MVKQMDGEHEEEEKQESGALTSAINKMLDILKAHKKPGVLGRGMEAEKMMKEENV